MNLFKTPIMKIKFYKIAVFLVIATLLLPILSGCTETQKSDGGAILAAAKEKLERSIEVNRICFGEGLSTLQEGGYPIGGYAEVDPTAAEAVGIRTVSDIKKLIREVYSAGTSAYVEGSLFHSDNSGEGYSSYSRYLDVTDEKSGESHLMTKKDYVPLAVGTASYANIRLTSQKKSTAEIMVDITVTDGTETREFPDTVLTMCYENGEWYFDELTYASLK